MDKQIVVFDSKEMKKHSVCYKTKQANAAIKSVYIMKTAFASGKVPDKIKITIEEEL
jgi:hypothetical protein